MKLMDRYIVRELIVPFLAGSFVIALLFALNQLIFILKTFNVQSVPASAMFQMIVYKMPYWLNMTLPAGISLAASLAVTRLARESEITAMRAVGVRVIRVILPVMLFGVVVAVGNYYLVEKVVPKAEKKANMLAIDAGTVSASPRLQSNVWLSLKGGFSATFSSVTRLADDSLLIKDAVLGDRPGIDTVDFYSAPEGTYKNGIWTFPNFTMWSISPKAVKLTSGVGKSLVIQQPIFLNDIFGQGTPEEKTAAELAVIINAGKAAGHDMTREEVLYYERFSVPASCIVFAMVAPIFALLFAKSGSFAGILVSFVMVLLYYNGYVITTEILGHNRFVSPWLAAWTPNIIFAVLGLFAIRRLE
jgi:lipopolysaccharide export system permease protein